MTAEKEARKVIEGRPEVRARLWAEERKWLTEDIAAAIRKAEGRGLERAELQALRKRDALLQRVNNEATGVVRHEFGAAVADEIAAAIRALTNKEEG